MAAASISRCGSWPARTTIAAGGASGSLTTRKDPRKRRATAWLASSVATAANVGTSQDARLARNVARFAHIQTLATDLRTEVRARLAPAVCSTPRESYDTHGSGIHG